MAEALGTRVRRLRVKRDMSQGILAQRLGLSVSTVVSIEKGSTRHASSLS